MARIPEHEVERLKREVSVERLAEARGIKLIRHGADLIGKCPFHDDKTPSLVITPAKNLWHCLGACSAGGTAIDWVMRMQGVGVSWTDGTDTFAKADSWRPVCNLHACTLSA